jgi:hypothetical protein
VAYLFLIEQCFSLEYSSTYNQHQDPLPSARHNPCIDGVIFPFHPVSLVVFPFRLKSGPLLVIVGISTQFIISSELLRQPSHPYCTPIFSRICSETMSGRFQSLLQEVL